MIQKLKKILLPGLAIVGTVAIVLFAFQFVNDQTINSKPESFSLIDRSSLPSENSYDSESSYNGKELPESVEGELTQRKIIKNGTLQLLVEKAEETTQEIKSIGKKLNGFVSESRIYEVSQKTKSGNITIRVPADKFDTAMEDIKKLAIKVEKENISAKDVTEEFIDLEARLKNSQAEEKQYLEIMKQAKTVEDTLKVASKLSQVRGQIERIQGQLKYLSDKIDLATISVDLTSEADVELFGLRWRPLFVLKQSFRKMLSSLTGYVDTIIAFAFALPAILLWLATITIVLIAGNRVVRWLWQKFFAKQNQKNDDKR